MKYLILLFSFIFTTTATAQVYLQLEIFNDPKAIKYSVGQKITYETNYDPGVWSKGRIEQILVEENTIVLNNGIVKLEDATKFMLYNQPINYTARAVQTFGLIWLVQGTLAATFGKNTSWSSVLSIGGGSYIGGWLFRKLFYKSPIKLNDKNRLRIVDTRFSIPDKS